jgi:hypothetical protein
VRDWRNAVLAALLPVAAQEQMKQKKLLVEQARPNTSPKSFGISFQVPGASFLGSRFKTPCFLFGTLFQTLLLCNVAMQQ